MHLGISSPHMARVEIARDEHPAAAVDLWRRGELHAAMDAFREAKHLDFVYQHRKALVEAGGCVEINQCVGCTGIATPSSRRRVDGMEDDAMIQHEGAVNF